MIQKVKNPPQNAGDLGSIPGLGRSPAEGNGNPLQYSGLENPHRRGSLAGHSPRGRKESDATKRLTHSLSPSAGTVQLQARGSQAAAASSWDSQARLQLLSGAICDGERVGLRLSRRRGGSASVPSAGRAQRVMGTMPALMRSSRRARPRASEIKRKRRKRRFDSNTKQIIPPGMEQNKSEWSLTAVIPTRKASAGGRGA